MAVNLYIVDTVMVVCAAGAVASATGEARRLPTGRRRLLYPGFFAILATILVLAFPEPSDLMDVQFWFILLISILLGIVRGAFIRMASDHYWKLVRLDRGIDSVLAAIAVLVVAILQFIIATSTGAENHVETTCEFAMGVISGYLFGRSIAAYFRARALHHHDLQEV
jgi:cation transport ATPase